VLLQRNPFDALHSALHFAGCSRATGSSVAEIVVCFSQLCEGETCVVSPKRVNGLGFPVLRLFVGHVVACLRTCLCSVHPGFARPGLHTHNTQITPHVNAPHPAASLGARNRPFHRGVTSPATETPLPPLTGLFPAQRRRGALRPVVHLRRHEPSNHIQLPLRRRQAAEIVVVEPSLAPFYSLHVFRTPP